MHKMTALKSLKLLLLCALLLFVSACASTAPQVYTDFDKNHSFSGYTRYAWAHQPPLMVEGNLPVPEVVQERATAAVSNALSGKGFEYVSDPLSADFLVAYSIGARDDIRVYQTGSTVYDNKDNWLWGKQYHSSHFSLVIDEELNRSYTRGVFAIDIFDAKTKSPVWHSKVSKPLGKKELSSEGEGLEDAAKAQLSNFPPQ